MMEERTLGPKHTYRLDLPFTAFGLVEVAIHELILALPKSILGLLMPQLPNPLRSTFLSLLKVSPREGLGLVGQLQTLLVATRERHLVAHQR
jgi:hypothetical protein